MFADRTPTVFISVSICCAIFQYFLCCLLFVGLRPMSAQTVKPKTAEKLKGHLQPFGESGNRKEIQVRSKFPEPHEFLVKYVEHSMPLKLAGVARNSRAVRLWSDDYLMALDVPENSVVQLETKKKENRSQLTTEMHFHDFLKIYNQTEHYMVDDVPEYLRPDIQVPCSLQCSELMEKGLAFAMMWFSSGGTKSVVHTDSFENINCLLRGEKSFVMMDPARDREKIKLRHDGAYSDVDVDSVDLSEYPALAEAEFYHVNVTAGDCLYIPYKWIHQVRSFNSNVAVNFWWDHLLAANVLQEKGESACQDLCDPNLSLDKVLVTGEESQDDDSSIREWLTEAALNGLTMDDFMDTLKNEFQAGYLPLAAEKLLLEIFKKLDTTADGQFSSEDHEHLSEKDWEEIDKDLSSLPVIIENEEIAEKREYAKYVEEDRKKDEL